VLRYVLAFRTATDSSSEGGFENPQAPKQVETSVNAVLRLEVLAVTPDAANPAAPPRVRLRTTYEKLATQTKSDVPDPQLVENETQLHALEGKSIEYTLNPDGTAADVRGLDEYPPEVRAAFTEWLGKLSLGVAQPAQGIAVGDKWSPPAPPLSQPIPILGVSWHTESTYVRDEPCSAAATENSAPRAGEEMCAVIRTTFTVVQKRLADQTPPEYKERELRTGGKMSGSAESLTYVSLASGFIVSVTQEGSEEMDLNVTHPEHQLHMRYSGKVKTKSQISQVKEN
jgi:hypothetical protein